MEQDDLDAGVKHAFWQWVGSWTKEKTNAMWESGRDIVKRVLKK